MPPPPHSPSTASEAKLCPARTLSTQVSNTPLSAASEAKPRPHAPAKQRRSAAHRSPCGEPQAMPHSHAHTGEPAAVTRTPRSRARLIAPTNRRRLMAKPCTPQCTPQAKRSFKPQSRNVRGRGARPLVFLSGDQKGDTLFEKRVSPFHCAPLSGVLKQCQLTCLRQPRECAQRPELVDVRLRELVAAHGKVLD